MRKKLLRFKENQSRKNLIEYGRPLFSTVKGHWLDLVFKNNNLITLELGAGRGEYSTALAEMHPERNFIGVDVKGDRLWFGAKLSEEEEIENVAFLRTEIERIEDFFAENEVSEIWITFPGPREKKSQANKRLTNNKFLDIYKKIIAEDGVIHLKTDSDFLFDFTISLLEERDDIKDLFIEQDVYSKDTSNTLSIKTRFEKMFIERGKTIKYLSFRFQ